VNVDSAFKMHSGPFDLMSTSTKNPINLKEDLIKVLTMQKVTYILVKVQLIKGEMHKFRCKKNSIVFDIQILKISDIHNLYYTKFKIKEGNTHIYNEICSKILSQLIM